MNTEVVVRVAVRLLAIWILVSAASGLAGVAALDRSTLGFGVVAGMSAAGVATQIVAAVLLWKYAAFVATRVAAGTPAGGAVGQGPVFITQAAVGVLGIFMLSSALPDALWYGVAFAGARLAGPSPLAGQPSYEAQIGLYTIGGMANGAVVLMRLLLGLFFVLRARGVTELVLGARTSEAEEGRPTTA